MQVCLDHFAAAIAPEAQVALVLDGAGRQGARSLVVRPNISLIPLPPYASELNPVERVWLHLWERLLSHRLLDGYAAILRACCEAWNALTPERVQSVTAFSWIAKVIP
jgi:transposase